MGARSGPAPPIRAPPFWAGRSRRRGLLGACLAALLAPAAGARGCDLSNSEFAGFLLRTRAFYKHNVFEVVDAQQVNRILAAREALLPVCPAAVLQAILLKLEENIIYEARAHQELMVAYAGYLHTAVFQGSLLPGDLLEWPLSEGLERTADIGRELAAHRELSSAMVMNFCQPQDRFGTVHGLSWLLEPPFGEPGDSEDGEDVGLLSDTDLFIYLVDKPWCKELDPELVERLRRAVRSLHLVPYTGGPRREEQTAYFKFIVDLYDSLPDFTIFVHPDAPEHQGADFPALTRALKLIRTQSVFAHDAIGYYPLAHQMVVDPKRTWGERYASSWRRFWRQLYDSPWDSLGYRPPQCRWDVHKGKYIAGLVEGAEGRQSRAGAKATCVELDDCFGVTCGTRLDPIEQAEADAEASEGLGPRSFRGSCTARRGEPPELGDSPGEEETSYVKHCAHEGGSAHEDAVYVESEAALRAATYSRHPASYLADYAEGEDEQRNETAARERCNELGSKCGGFTCDAGGASCTVRAGDKLTGSPIAELSYRKEAAAAGPGLAEGPGASAAFQFYTGSQSIVRKDRIRLWPRREYATLGADGVFCSDFSGFFEAVWHAMFGEPLSQWPRERDPRLPLYLKWGTGTLYSYGDEGVI